MGSLKLRQINPTDKSDKTTMIDNDKSKYRFVQITLIQRRNRSSGGPFLEQLFFRIDKILLCLKCQNVRISECLSGCKSVCVRGCTSVKVNNRAFFSNGGAPRNDRRAGALRKSPPCTGKQTKKPICFRMYKNENSHYWWSLGLKLLSQFFKTLDLDITKV